MSARLAGLAAVLLLLATEAGASHLPGLSDGEESCQLATAKALGKFQRVKTKCLVKCDKRAAKGKDPEGDCLPPYAGKTADCVAAAEAKATEAIEVGCAADCPECYNGGDCPAHAAQEVAGTEEVIEIGAAIVRCDDSGSPDGLTAIERSCRQLAAAQAAKLAASYEKCLASCRSREQKGKLPPDACKPPDVQDEKTMGCIDRAFSKCVLTISDKCPDPPECLAGDFFFLCAGVLTTEDTFDPEVFCASPSGAFVD
jgi:hypothetical protein